MFIASSHLRAGAIQIRLHPLHVLHGCVCKPDTIPVSLSPNSCPHACTPYRLYSRLHQNARKRKSSPIKIKAEKLLVIDEDGKNLGEMATLLAAQLAESKHCKLVQVSRSIDGKAPVYKIMSTKTLYEADKKRKEMAKKTKTKVKEIQITTTISPHDLAVKVEHIKDLLQKSIRISLCIAPRRDRTGEATGTMEERQREMIERVVEGVKGYGVVQGKESVTGRGVIILQLAPVASHAGKAAEQEDSDGSTDSNT